MFAGMVICQIRTLRSFGWFTNVNIWLKIVECHPTVPDTKPSLRSS
jgi:hypothetical protein